MSGMTSSNGPADESAQPRHHNRQQPNCAATSGSWRRRRRRRRRSMESPQHRPAPSDEPIKTTSREEVKVSRKFESQAKVLTDFSIDSIIGAAAASPPAARRSERDGAKKSSSAIPVGGGDKRARTTCCATETPTHDRLESIPRTTTTLRPGMSTNGINGEPLKQLTGVKMELDDNHTTALAITSAHQKQRYSRPKVFSCRWCPLAFSNNGQLRNHERIHTGERPFSCQVPTCNKTFTRNEELTRHKLIHTGTRPHKCSHCDKTFGRKDHLKKHERTHERKRAKRSSSSSSAMAAAAATATATNRHRNCVQPEARNLPADFDEFLPIKTELQTASFRAQHLAQHLAHPHPFHFAPPLEPATSQVHHYERLLHHQQPSALSPPPVPLPTSSWPADLTFSLAAALALTTNSVTSTASSNAANSCPLPIMQTGHQPTHQAITMTSAASPMQQLASDYWQGWCNLLDRQQQQQHQLFQSLNSHIP